ncbi:MAG: polyphenol oxidase family protein [Deltaproteobacteria bacterium]|jgi:YfiH family protein|nr:polyphenol oxidase family protein [Deltaproteobacteria bacterium]
MLKHIYENITYYTYNIFRPYPQLRHGVFTRGGDREFNLSFSSGDPGEVLKNLKTVEKALNLPPVAQVGQTHGAEILDLTKITSYSPRAPKDLKEGYDAMIGGPLQPLLVKLADCQGIILFAPENNLLALVHSGWRGSVQNILGKTVASLKSKGVNPKKILAAISPSLGPCCFEFKDWKTLLPAHLHRYRLKDTDYFDFWTLSHDQLTGEGMLSLNIHNPFICTLCSSEFFSHRRGDRGRFALVAGIT